MAGRARRKRTIIAAFPAEGRYRLDWSGPMQARERGSVFPVRFSRVSDDVKHIVDNEAIYESPKIVVNVGLGYAPILQPGTIWEDGAFKTRGPYNQIELETDIGSNITMLHLYGRQHDMKRKPNEG